MTPGCDIACSQWEHERLFCKMVKKGLAPCLITVAPMNFLRIPKIRDREATEDSVRTSGRMLHEVDHYPPSKCPDQDWWHLTETQVAQGGSVDLPRNQRNWPIEATRLQATHSSERSTEAKEITIPTAIRQTAEQALNI